MKRGRLSDNLTLFCLSILALVVASFTLSWAGRMLTNSEMMSISGEGDSPNDPVAHPYINGLYLGDTTVPVGDTVYFDGIDSYDPDMGGYITEYEWDFGDGNTSSDSITTHVYNTPDYYVAWLTVWDNNTPDRNLDVGGPTYITVFKVDITSVRPQLANIDKFIPLSNQNNINKVTITYDIYPTTGSFVPSQVRLNVYKNDFITLIYERSLNAARGTGQTTTWDGADNQTNNNHADPRDNPHYVEIEVTAPGGKKHWDWQAVNVVPLLDKVIPTHSPFSATHTAPRNLTVRCILKGCIDDTGTEANNYLYYTENGDSLQLWDGNHYYMNNDNQCYDPANRRSYWIELLNQVQHDPEQWSSTRLGNLQYAWNRVRGPANILPAGWSSIRNFTAAGTYVYTVTVTNSVDGTAIQTRTSASEKVKSRPDAVTYVENVSDSYMVHLKGSVNDAYGWAESFLRVPYYQVHDGQYPVDYHGIDCAGLVHAANYLNGNAFYKAYANSYVTSSAYSSALGAQNPTANINAQRNDWAGIDRRTANGYDGQDNDNDGQTDEFDEGFDGAWGHIVLLRSYNFD